MGEKLYILSSRNDNVLFMYTNIQRITLGNDYIWFFVYIHFRLFLLEFDKIFCERISRKENIIK